MPKRFIVLLTVCIWLILTVVLAKPAVIFFVKRQLQGVFKESQISIGGCVLRPDRISISDVEIKKPDFYNIQVKETAVNFNLFSILDPSSRKLFLRSVKIYSNTKNRITDFTDAAGSASPAPFFATAEISELNLDLKTPDFSARGLLSCELDLIKQSVNSLDFKLDFFESSGLRFEKIIVRVSGVPPGDFSIAKIKYDKLAVIDIKGKLTLEGFTAASLQQLQAQLLDGQVKGDLEVKMGKEIGYEASFKCEGLDIDKLVHDFNWQEKFLMSGKLEGDLKLKGKGQRFELLEGGFQALSPGGKLMVLDEKSLQDLARNTPLPFKSSDLFVESLKDYSYNTGIINLGLENGNLNLKVGLDGQAGKRDLDIVLHDFKLSNFKMEGL